jgi:Flp pilus assembly pilin Flp
MRWGSPAADHASEGSRPARQQVGASTMLTSAYNNSIWMRNRIVERMQDERGNALVEYLFLFSLIVIVCIAAVTFLGSSTSGRQTDSANQIIAAN